MANTRLRKIAAIAFVNAIACADECVVTLAQSQGYTDFCLAANDITFPLQIIGCGYKTTTRTATMPLSGSAPYPGHRACNHQPGRSSNLGDWDGLAREMHVLVEYGRNFIAQEQQLDNAFAFAEKLKSMANQERENNSRPMPPNTVKYISRDKYEIMTNGCRNTKGKGSAAMSFFKYAMSPTQ